MLCYVDMIVKKTAQELKELENPAHINVVVIDGCILCQFGTFVSCYKRPIIL